MLVDGGSLRTRRRWGLRLPFHFGGRMTGPPGRRMGFRHGQRVQEDIRSRRRRRMNARARGRRTSSTSGGLRPTTSIAADDSATAAWKVGLTFHGTPSAEGGELECDQRRQPLGGGSARGLGQLGERRLGRRRCGHDPPRHERQRHRLGNRRLADARGPRADGAPRPMMSGPSAMPAPSSTTTATPGARRSQRFRPARSPRSTASGAAHATTSGSSATASRSTSRVARSATREVLDEAPSFEWAQRAPRHCSFISWSPARRARTHGLDPRPTAERRRLPPTARLHRA